MPTVTEQQPGPTQASGRYPKEFRRDAAALAIDQHRTVATWPGGLVEQTLGNWVRQERVDRGERDGLSTEEREEMSRLRREVKRLTHRARPAQTKCGFWVKELDR